MMQNLDVLISKEKISERLAELGKEISLVYGTDLVVVVSVLKGAFIFTADLIRTITSPIRVEFIGVSSYVETHSTGHVRITHDLVADIKDCHVLLVEDIIDTGITIDFLLNTLKIKEPKSIRVCTFLSKPSAHIMKHKIDFVGFEIHNEFVVGYGLDYNQRFRELPYVGQFK